MGTGDINAVDTLVGGTNVPVNNGWYATRNGLFNLALYEITNGGLFNVFNCGADAGCTYNGCNGISVVNDSPNKVSA